MPIGGVKEKILAAKRNHVPHVILPHQNKSDLVGAEEIAEGINVIWVHHADEILSRVLIARGRKKTFQCPLSNEKNRHFWKCNARYLYDL